MVQKVQDMIMMLVACGAIARAVQVVQRRCRGGAGGAGHLHRLHRHKYNILCREVQGGQAHFSMTQDAPISFVK